MGRARVKTAPDGTECRAKSFFEGRGKDYREVIRWVDSTGKVWDASELIRDEIMRSRENRGGSKAARGKLKKDEVELNFSEIGDDRRRVAKAMPKLSERDRGRIVERLDSPPRDCKPGFSRRDARDMERVIADVDRDERRAALIAAKKSSVNDILSEALRAAKAIRLSVS